MSGCAVCLYDLYEGSLLIYRACHLLRSGRGWNLWGSHGRSSHQDFEEFSATSQHAFEAMENTLRAKQQGRVGGMLNVDTM